MVVTHGTDTLIETAAFLARSHADSFPDKVICVTGAMRPERFVDTDAQFNLGVCFGALDCAAPGVYVCMNGRVRSWNRKAFVCLIPTCTSHLVWIPLHPSNSNLHFSSISVFSIAMHCGFIALFVALFILRASLSGFQSG